MRFAVLAPSAVPWNSLDQFEDRTVFQTQQWVNFVSETQHAQIVCAELRDPDSVVGYFTGLISNRLGVQILGSPFPGWATPYMGFNLLAGVSRADALKALVSFAFHDLKCLHIEVCDPYFNPDDGKASGFSHQPEFTYETKLNRSEEELFAAMSSKCRNKIRQAEKNGLRIEEAHDRAFAAEYYEQLMEVFAKNGLTPTYPLSRVEKLIDNLLPSGHLLLLRARDPSGKCVATSIYAGMNKLALFWGNASLQTYLHLRPNEILHWYAMRYWKRNGAEVFDWGGHGAYKEKYGVKPVFVPRFRQSRLKFMEKLRDYAQRAVKIKHRIIGKYRR